MFSYLEFKIEADTSKTLIIQVSDYVKAPLYTFDAVCRWTKRENPQGYYISGLEITSISEDAKKKLAKLMEFVTLG